MKKLIQRLLSWWLPATFVLAVGSRADAQNVCANVNTFCGARIIGGGGGGSGDLLSTNNLSDVASASTSRTNLGLAIGTNVQAYNANLASLAGLTFAADTCTYWSAAATANTTNCTTAGRSMIGAVDAAAQTALLSAVVGDSGAGGTKGLVPAPAAGDAAASKFLKADGTWTFAGNALTSNPLSQFAATTSAQLAGVVSDETGTGALVLASYPTFAGLESSYIYVTGSTTAASGVNFCEDAAGTDTYACSISPAISSYVTGATYNFKAQTANTGAATINLNSLGAKSIVKTTGGITTALTDNDIRAGSMVTMQYDGTNMQLLSPRAVDAITLNSTTVNGSSSYVLRQNFSGQVAASENLQNNGSTVTVGSGTSGTSKVLVVNNASGIGNYLEVQDSGTAVFTIADLGNIQIGRTVTAAGTTGAQTINKAAGTVNFAPAATTLVVTNSLATTSSIIHGMIRTADTTCTNINSIVPAAGSFTITLNAACTAETSVGFLVTN